MTEAELAAWRVRYGQLQTCTYYHGKGTHKRELCPVDEAACDFIKAYVVPLIPEAGPDCPCETCRARYDRDADVYGEAAIHG